MKNTMLTVLVLFLVVSIGFVPAFSQYVIRDSALAQSTAGGFAKSDNFGLYAVIGQVSPPDFATSNQYALSSGFIHALKLSAFTDVNASFSLAPGTKKENYRLISVPAALNSPHPRDFLEDDLGKYDKKSWRLFDCLDGRKANVEYPNTRSLTPGVGLFLIVKEGGKTIDLGAGEWLEILSCAIELHPGYNFIGNPYLMELTSANLTLSSGDTTLQLWDYTGGWRSATKILPWHGYLVSVTKQSTLLFDPFNSKTGKLGKSQMDLAQGDGWRIQISAHNDAAADEWNFAGVSEAAQKDQDPLDWFEPPAMGDYVSLYFPHPEWQTFLEDYASDYRAPQDDGYAWDLAIRSNLSAPATLSFSGLAEVPEQYEIWLVDEVAQISQDLRTSASYLVALTGEDQPRPLKLLVGGKEFIGKTVGDFQAIPKTYELAQNFPNPFNPSTTIRYGLPMPGRVSLKIYNILGEQVVTLVNNQEKPAGYHVAIWDGKNQGGQQVANGVYIYQIQVASFTETRKMMLMK